MAVLEGPVLVVLLELLGGLSLFVPVLLGVGRVGRVAAPLGGVAPDGGVEGLLVLGGEGAAVDVEEVLPEGLLLVLLLEEVVDVEDVLAPDHPHHLLLRLLLYQHLPRLQPRYRRGLLLHLLLVELNLPLQQLHFMAHLLP